MSLTLTASGLVRLKTSKDLRVLKAFRGVKELKVLLDQLDRQDFKVVWV
jgi:hypothetical protein